MRIGNSRSKVKRAAILSDPGRYEPFGAADKAAIQLVKVQPYQLLVSDT